MTVTTNWYTHWHCTALHTTYPSTSCTGQPVRPRTSAFQSTWILLKQIWCFSWRVGRSAGRPLAAQDRTKHRRKAGRCRDSVRTHNSNGPAVEAVHASGHHCDRYSYVQLGLHHRNHGYFQNFFIFLFSFMWFGFDGQRGGGWTK